MQELPYLTASDYYRERFGCKVYKLALDSGCTCPNRDGTLGKGGCIFCSTSGSGDFVPSPSLSIEAQIEAAKLLVEKKAFGRRGKQNQKEIRKNPKYLAYFQSFTATYGNPEQIVERFRRALNCKDVEGLAIATRPDCLNQDILERIDSLAENHFVQIELGLQTAKDSTAEYIRRGYKTEIYFNTVQRIKSASPDIHIVTQLIFGLPGETEDDMLDSVKKAVLAGTDGLKFTVLYVLKGTDLSKDYADGKFQTLSMGKYFEIVKKAIHLANDFSDHPVVIHRITGDGPKSLLIEPQWTANKRNVQNYARNFLSMPEN